MYNSRIIGMGHYVPENVVTNDDLSKLMNTSDQWIQERTGIHQRRWAVKGDGNSTFSMGLKAAEKAINNAKIEYEKFVKDSKDHELAPSVKFELQYLGKGIDEIPVLKHITS